MVDIPDNVDVTKLSVRGILYEQLEHNEIIVKSIDKKVMVMSYNIEPFEPLFEGYEFKKGETDEGSSGI